jgi:anthranilate synthase component 1
MPAVESGMSTEPLQLKVVIREFVADTLTPISAYLALATPGRSCLLESVEGTDRIARFSFLGLDYLETVVIDDDPAMLDRVREILRRYSVDTTGLPFPGGAVCAFTYDAARVLERIGPKPPADVEFSDALILIPGTWVVFDHFTHGITLIGFARDEAERPAVSDRLDRYIAQLLGVRPSVPGNVRARGKVDASMDEATYIARVADAKHAIFEGDVRTRNPSPYMFFLEAGGRAVFGASPEFLVRLDEQSARLRPLAGTRPRGQDPAHDNTIAAELLANAKERAEHVMLVDLGRNDLGVVCKIGSVRVNELMQIERYSHVMHIVSNVTGELREDKDALDLFAAAFPAGTVTGTPKIRAMQIIDTLEPVRRGFYAGSIAHLDFDGGMDSCIVLRSVATVGGRAYWQASAGIVADSDPKAEYEEVLAKTRIVRDVLDLDR